MRAILAALLVPVTAQLAAQEPRAGLSEATFEALHRQVVPATTEPWETIPWRIDLGNARREAAARGVPLFLWTMNGHPLGCT